MVTVKVAENIVDRCCAKTATTVRIFNEAHTEYRYGRTVDGDGTKPLLVYSKHYYIEAGRTQEIQVGFPVKRFSLNA